MKTVNRLLLNSDNSVFINSGSAQATFYSASAELPGERDIHWSLRDPPGDEPTNVVAAVNALRELFALAEDHPSLRESRRQ